MNISKKLTFVLLLFGSFNLSSQSVPNLHVEGNVTHTTLLSQGFEGTMGAFSSQGDSGWAFNNTDSYSGNFSAQTSLSASGYTGLEFTVVIPSNTSGHLSFYCKADIYGFAYLAINQNYSPITADGNWNQILAQLSEGTYNIVIYLENYYPGTISTMNVDDVNVEYFSNYALRIADGSEGYTKVLMSDDKGYATWKYISQITGLLPADNGWRVTSGNIILDTNGEATVEMEEWSDGNTSDFRYQLTAIGASGPNLFISEKVSDNTFRIAGGTANMEVSWTVRGRRKKVDKVNRIEVETERFEKLRD